MAFKMSMGDHSGNDSPENFNNKDKEVINKAPAFMPISALTAEQRETHGGNSIPFVSLKDKSNIRPLFNRAFSNARKQGHKTFGFGYDRDNDGNILADEIHVYNTKLKGEK